MLESYEWKPPANESYEHFLLKNSARIYLVDRGLRYVGTEIFVPGINDEISNKQFVDCVGVDKKQEVSYGIEVKVSISDFNNGYCTRCNYNYILCPRDMIKSNDLPDYVGLIYGDVDKIQFVTNQYKNRLQGIELVKKAKYHINDFYYDNRMEDFNYDKMFAHTQRIVECITRSNLNELLYHSNNVPLAKLTGNRKRRKRKRR